MELKGADKLIAKLKKNATLNDVKDVVRLNTSEMHRNAQKLAPVDTTFLRRNVKQDTNINGGFTGKVASTAEYAPYQEYGTRFQPGKAHIRPSFHQQKKKFVDDMKRLTK